MKINRVSLVCVAVLVAGVLNVTAQSGVYEARISLTATKTNAAGFVKTKITENDIIARCAQQNALDPSHLKLVFAGASLIVADVVATNEACGVLSFMGSVPTNVLVRVVSPTNPDAMKALGFFPLVSMGEDGVIPADFSGTVVFSLAVNESTNKPSVKLVGTIQGGSKSNNCVYTGKVIVGGKAIFED